jgi:hypothetical protein
MEDDSRHGTGRKGIDLISVISDPAEFTEKGSQTDTKRTCIFLVKTL